PDDRVPSVALLRRGRIRIFDDPAVLDQYRPAADRADEIPPVGIGREVHLDDHSGQEFAREPVCAAAAADEADLVLGYGRVERLLRPDLLHKVASRVIAGRGGERRDRVRLDEDLAGIAG